MTSIEMQRAFEIHTMVLIMYPLDFVIKRTTLLLANFTKNLKKLKKPEISIKRICFMCNSKKIKFDFKYKKEKNDFQ